MELIIAVGLAVLMTLLSFLNYTQFVAGLSQYKQTHKEEVMVRSLMSIGVVILGILLILDVVFLLTFSGDQRTIMMAITSGFLAAQFFRVMGSSYRLPYTSQDFMIKDRAIRFQSVQSIESGTLIKKPKIVLFSKEEVKLNRRLVKPLKTLLGLK